MQDAPAIETTDLSRSFGAVRAVDGLNMRVPTGRIYGLVGPDGAGKTTTLRMLLHLVQPTSGRALVFGRRYQDLERPAARVGAVCAA